jgi:hypothetical protein
MTPSLRRLEGGEKKEKKVPPFLGCYVFHFFFLFMFCCTSSSLLKTYFLYSGRSTHSNLACRLLIDSSEYLFLLFVSGRVVRSKQRRLVKAAPEMWRIRDLFDSPHRQRLRLSLLLLLCSVSSSVWAPPALPATQELAARDAPSQRVSVWLLGHCGLLPRASAVPPPSADWKTAISAPASTLAWDSWYAKHFNSENASSRIVDTCANAVVMAMAPWCCWGSHRVAGSWNSVAGTGLEWTDDPKSRIERRAHLPAPGVNVTVAFKQKRATAAAPVSLDVCLAVSLHRGGLDRLKSAADRLSRTVALSGTPHRLMIVIDAMEAEQSSFSAAAVLRLFPKSASVVVFSRNDTDVDGDQAYRAAAGLCSLAADDDGHAPLLALFYDRALEELEAKKQVLSIVEERGGTISAVVSAASRKTRGSFVIVEAEREGAFAVSAVTRVGADTLAFPARGSSPMTLSRIARGAVIGGAATVHKWLLGLASSHSPQGGPAFREEQDGALLRALQLQHSSNVVFGDLPSLWHLSGTQFSPPKAFLERFPRCMAFSTVPHSNTTTMRDLQLVRVMLAPADASLCDAARFLPACYVPHKRTFTLLSSPASTSDPAQGEAALRNGDEAFRFVGKVFSREGLCLYGGPKWTARVAVYAWFAPSGIAASEVNQSEAGAGTTCGAPSETRCVGRRLWKDLFGAELLEEDTVNQLEPDEDVPRKTPNLPPVHVKHAR